MAPGVMVKTAYTMLSLTTLLTVQRCNDIASVKHHNGFASAIPETSPTTQGGTPMGTSGREMRQKELPMSKAELFCDTLDTQTLRAK